MKTLVYEFIEKLNHGLVGPLCQKWGRKLLATGLRVQGSPYYEDRRTLISPVVASLRGVEVDGKSPLLDKANFVAPNAAIFGNVSFEAGVALLSPVFSLVRNDSQRREKRNRHRQEVARAGQRAHQGRLRTHENRQQRIHRIK